MQKFKSMQESLVEEIARRVAAGKEGAVRVERSPESGELQLRIGSRVLQVLKLHIYLGTDRQLWEESEKSFRGTLYIDNHGANACEARLALLDETGESMLASDTDAFYGHVLIVALLDGKESKPLATHPQGFFLKHRKTTQIQGKARRASNGFPRFSFLVLWTTRPHPVC